MPFHLFSLLISKLFFCVFSGTSFYIHMAVWPLSVTQISGKVRPFTMEWSLGSFRTLWRQTTNHIICSECGIIFDNVRLEPIKLFGEAHWLEVSIFSSDVKFQKCALVASIAYLSKEPRMVRAFGPL